MGTKSQRIDSHLARALPFLSTGVIPDALQVHVSGTEMAKGIAADNQVSPAVSWIVSKVGAIPRPLSECYRGIAIPHL